jgi:hypothetical protein
MIDAPISYGELIDKITIFEIKAKNISESEKLIHINKELILLTEKAKSIENIQSADDIKLLLLKVNEDLWNVEDKLREHELSKSFDDDFIELARSVYHLNDERSRLKKKINVLLNSDLIEEKSYASYAPVKHKITVMISTYNAGEWIKNRLDNLMDLTNLAKCEIWCVNANSPDQRDHDIPSQYSNIKYIKLTKRKPLYTVWNHIIKNSDSDYITNANADDLVSPDCYAKLAEILDNHPEVGFAYPSWSVTQEANQKWDSLKADRTGQPGHFNGDINKSGVGHFPMWRRSLHEKYGYFDDEFKALADADWWMRCYYNNVRFKWLDEYLACYLYRNGENLWHKAINNNEWERFHNKLSEYKKK